MITPISDHLRADLADKARRLGMLYWLDREGTYTAFVDDLCEGGADAFPHPVVAFRGSYLETMLELERRFDSVDPSPVLLHLPAHHEESIRDTPLLEFIRAGKRYRIALDTLITDAASGRVRPDAIQAFLDSAPTELVAADAWMTGELEQPGGDLSAALELMNPCSVLDDLLAQGSVAGKVGSDRERGELWTWLELRLGLDSAWRAEAPAATESAEIAATITEWALCVEYVHDLSSSREPRTPRLLRLRSLPPAVVKACMDAAGHLRKRHPAHYERLAREVQERLPEEVEGAEPSDLGRIDTFPFEEETVLQAAIDALRNDGWVAARAWADARLLAGGSFWVRDAPRRAAWELILAAVELGEALTAAGASLAAEHSHEAAIDRYTTFGATVDRAHRRLEQERWARRHVDLPHATELRAGLNWVRRLHARWADDWARDYAELCGSLGFLPPTHLQQRTFFEEVVRPWASESGPVALFLVDALRFEMAGDIALALQGKAATSVRLNARLAELPTLTDVGMNLLAPVAVGGRARPLLKGSKFKGFQAAEYQVNSPDTRHRAMQSAVGGATCPYWTLEEVLARTPQSLRLGLSKANLVVVHSLEIDKAGENGVGYAVFERILQSLQAAWKLLREAGIKRFVITADHGFLLLDPSRPPVPHGKKTDPKRRHVVYPVPVQEPGKVSVALSDLGYDGQEAWLVLPEDTRVFDVPGKAPTFVHGGNSLQERVIPVLTVEHRQASGAGTLRYRVQVEARPGVAGMHCLRGRVEVVAQEGLPFGGVQQVGLSLQAADSSGVLAEIVDVRDAARTGAGLLATVGRDFEVFFRLHGRTDARVPVEVFHPSRAADVEPGSTARRFEVSVDELAPEGGESTASTASWLDEIKSPGPRRVFELLAAHGSVTEVEATVALGSPRAFRRFSARFDDLAAFAPFGIRIEVVASGKRFVREGGES